MTKTDGIHGSLIARLTAVNLGFLMLLFMAESRIAERNWLTTLVTYAPQQLFGLPLLAMLIWSLSRRRWRAAAVNSAAFVLFAFFMLGFSVPLHGARGSGRAIRVMTYNIHHASQGAGQIARDVNAARADIVCFQETNILVAKRDPVAELEKALPGWYHRSHGQLAVFSRFPIVAWHVHEPAVEFWRVFLEITVDVRATRLTVINVHLNTAAGPGSLTDHYGSMASYLQGSTGARSAQVAELLRITRRINDPLIIAGDFNTPPRGRIYGRLVETLTDSFRGTGWGFGYSYRSDLPIMRIDYIFAGKGVRPVNCRTLKLAGSDHRPVLATLAFSR